MDNITVRVRIGEFLAKMDRLEVAGDVKGLKEGAKVLNNVQSLQRQRIDYQARLAGSKDSRERDRLVCKIKQMNKSIVTALVWNNL